MLVGDEIFPLRTWLMKPYPRKQLTKQQRVFNYGFSRARRTIHNFFGILAARWRIFRRPIRADELTVEKIVKAAVCVHNYLLYTDNASYMPQGFVDSYNADGTIVNGSWRQDVQPLAAIPQQGSINYTITAKQTRYSLCKLFQTFCFRLY